MADLATDLHALVSSTDSGKDYGVTTRGFVPKPLARLVEEKLAAARVLFGDDVDLTAGSAVRKVLEVICVEELRCWEHLAAARASTSVVTAEGDFLSGLGEELGIPRPYRHASGSVTFSLATDLPAGVTELVLDRGTRLLTDGGHDYVTDEWAEISNGRRSVTLPVTAFTPGPGQNLDPSRPGQALNAFNQLDLRSDAVRAAEAAAGTQVLKIVHTAPTTGGQLVWSDDTYRDLLLAYPRNLWTPEALRIAVSLVPGVRQVLVQDLYGGLDINQSIFGNFSFVERLFSAERSLASPYFVTVLVAKGDGAIWHGRGQLKARVQAALDQVRPVGILPRVEEASEVAVGFSCDLTVEGLPIPAGTPTAVNTTDEARALKQRILTRVRRYTASLPIAAQVHYAEVMWAIMEEPGVTNCTNLRLRRYPARVGANAVVGGHEVAGSEGDVPIGQSEVAVLVEDLDQLRIH